MDIGAVVTRGSKREIRMSFGNTAFELLAGQLAALGFGHVPPITENSVHFMSDKYDVVVFFDEQNFDVNARVRIIDGGPNWMFIREIVHDEEAIAAPTDPAEIGPEPIEDTVRDLGRLIARLP